MLSVVVMTLSSCLGSNDTVDVSLYEETAITGMTLGTLTKYTKTVSAKTGNDTVVRSTFAGSAYKMTIDHLGCRIYNQDALPAGTDLAHVLISSVSTLKSGVVGLKSLTSDAYVYVTTTDSIDFTVPRIFRVYAANGSGWRDYTVTLHADEVGGSTFEWTRVSSDSTACWQFTSPVTLVSLNGHLVLSGSSSDTDRSVYVSDDGISWTPSAAPLSHFSKMLVHDGYAYVLNQDGLLRSADGLTWEKVAEKGTLTQLIASGTKELFAVGQEGVIFVSTDQGRTWTADATEDGLAGVAAPTAICESVTWPYSPSDSTDCVLLVGTADLSGTQSAFTLWRKISQYGGIGKGGQWVDMPLDDTNRMYLPLSDLLSLTYYDAVVLALCRDNSTEGGLTVYQSRDQGITWQKSTTYAVPAGMAGPTASFAVRDGVLWMVSGQGEVWRGKTN